MSIVCFKIPGFFKPGGRQKCKKGFIIPDIHSGVFLDDFNTTLDPSWTIDNPCANTEVFQEGTELKFEAGDNCDYWTETKTAPIITRPAFSGNWTIETNITSGQDITGGVAGLILYENRNNASLFGRREGVKLGSYDIINGSGVYDSQYTITATSTHLRIRKVLTSYHFEYSNDGESWTELRNATFSNNFVVGLVVTSWGSVPTVGFDYFKMTQD